MRETEPWETDWIVISSRGGGGGGGGGAMGQASLFVYCQSCFERFTRYEVVTEFRLQTGAKISD